MTSILRNLNVSSGGKRICGIPKVGVLASQIPTGFPLAALLANDVDAGSPNRLYRVEMLTQPSAGNLYVYEDSSFSFTGAPDGTYTGSERVRKYDPGVGLVSTEDTTYSLTIGAGTAPSPTVTGITALPASATVAGGSTTNATVAVQGTNSPPQTFTSTKVSGPGSVNGAAMTMPAANYTEQISRFRFRPTLDSTNHYADVVLTVAALPPPDTGTIDATKVAAGRVVAFPGNKRVVTFPGNTRKVTF